MALNQRDDVKRMKELARRLRVDAINGAPIGVFELPTSSSRDVAPTRSLPSLPASVQQPRP
jgi:hypothetical protein